MKLSIITINYNNLEGLRRTYDSVVCQTWTDYEWIIIDGGSTDGSREFIEQHQDKFAYWCSEPDKGVYNAMNKGIAKAKGEYLNFMNSGDSFHDECVLENVFAKINNEDIFYGDWILLFEKEKVLVSDYKKMTLLNLFKEGICHQAMFIKLDLLRKKGYDETYMILADWKRWIDAVIDGCTTGYIPLVICCFDCSGISFKRDDKYRAEESRLFDEYLRQFHPFIKFARNKYIIELLGLYDKSIYYQKIIINALEIIKKLETPRRFLKKLLNRE